MFHALTWVTTVVGVVLLFRAGRFANNVWSGRVLAGGMVLGWGIFNLVEGTIDHLVLGIHHVHPGDGQLAWDLGFVFVGGLAFILVGALMIRGARDYAWTAMSVTER